MFPPRKLFFFGILITGAIWLLWLYDNGLGIGWPANALRNWQQFGLGALHGQLVYNAGGFEALRQPQIYHGMSPWCLYPVYFCTQFSGWTPLGTTSFYLLLTTLVLWGVWSLLGKNAFALLVGVVVILSPGYGRWLSALDPNAISVLFGIPFAAAVTELLKKNRQTASDYLLLILLATAFVPLNWTTAWLLAPFGIYLLLSKRVHQATTLTFLTLSAIGAIIFVAVSMHAKSGGQAADGKFLGGYSWGNYGYGTGLTTARAFTRIFFVSLVGLLPLLVIWITAFFRKNSGTGLKFFHPLLPLAMAMLVIIALRNYFGHHPWMSGPVVIAGLIFSSALIAETMTVNPVTPNCWRQRILVATICFVYGLCVLAFYRTNGSEGRSLIQFVRQATARTDWILVVKDLDPATAQIGDRIGESLDRHVVVLNSLSDFPSGQPGAILSTVPIHNHQIIAEKTADSTVIDKRLQSVAGWFNRVIAHRNPGDRMNIPSHFYLYQPTP